MTIIWSCFDISARLRWSVFILNTREITINRNDSPFCSLLFVDKNIAFNDCLPNLSDFHALNLCSSVAECSWLKITHKVQITTHGSARVVPFN